MLHAAREPRFWKDVLIAWLISSGPSGLPSTILAVATGGDPMEATRAAGLMVVSPDAAPNEILLAATAVHMGVAFFWTAVLGLALPRERRLLWSLLAGVGIAVLDLRVIAGLFFPSIVALSFWVQLLDHLAFCGLVALVLDWRARRAERALAPAPAPSP
jgi:hypothetical protein